jgi:1,6-anhydro-N-acetylmuramate kinase
VKGTADTHSRTVKRQLQVYRLDRSRTQRVICHTRHLIHQPAERVVQHVQRDNVGSPCNQAIYVRSE